LAQSLLFSAPVTRQIVAQGEATAIARPTARLSAIRELLERDHVCLEIVRYLSQHNDAADTARGIADWWIRRDLPSTATALVQLERHGIVRSYVVQDATSVYGYTKNPLLRQTLQNYVEAAARTAAEPA
jgi:hypothetical protein